MPMSNSHERSLQALGNRPTLGEITRVLNGLDDSSSLWQEADYRFGRIGDRRPDYRIWRKFFRGPDAMRLRSVNYQEILTELESGNIEVIWGLIGLLPSLFNNNTRKATFTSQEWSRIFGVCNKVFTIGIKLIPRAEQSCHLAELLLIGTMLSYCWETRCHEITCNEALRFLETLITVLKKIDQTWELGISFSRDELEKIKKGRDLFSYDPIMAISQLPLKLYYAGKLARSVAEKSQTVNEETNKLLNHAYLLCLTAWRFSRNSRRGERIWREGKDPVTLNLDLDGFAKQELAALCEATHSAWAAGQYLTFPVLAHLYLWSAAANHKNMQFANLYSKWIHQLGLEIPTAFKLQNGKSQAPKRIYPALNNSPYWRRIAQDQQNHPDWRMVLDAYGEWKAFLPESGEPNADPRFYDPFQLFKSLSFAVDEGQYSNPTVARSAFRLALKYGWTGLGEKLLSGFQPTKKDVIDFCHHLKRIQQACPFGIDDSDDQHPAWLRTLKASWASLSPNDSLNGQERLATHEVLVGRTVELIRWKGKSASPILIKKFNGLTSDDEIRAASGENIAVISSGVGTINASKVSGLMQAVSNSRLGECVCISVVRLKGDTFSFLAVDRSCATREKWIATTKPFSGIGVALRNLNATRDDWLKIGMQNYFEPPIDWDESFQELCRFMLQMAQRLNKDCGWLMLALEQDLAELPWQDLVRRSWNGKKQVFVSLIPNIGWASRSYQDVRAFPKDSGNKLDLSGESEFEEFKRAIEHDLKAIPVPVTSTAIFLGHGKSENGFTAIRAGTSLLSRDAWLDVGAYRTLTIHSCSAGRLHGGFLGDFGGVPALALATGCRLVCAPVTEVPLRTAKILHKHHVSKSDSLEFGCRYMQALAEDPWVGVYTCYGLGNQFVADPKRKLLQ